MRSPFSPLPLFLLLGLLGVLLLVIQLTLFQIAFERLGLTPGTALLLGSAIKDLGVPLASIGGAGTFDGTFLTGIVAVLLA